MGPENSSLPVLARLQAPMPCRLDWHDGGYHDMVQELKLNGMMPLAAESFCKLMRDAGRPASDAILPPQMLPFTLEAEVLASAPGQHGEASCS